MSSLRRRSPLAGALAALLVLTVLLLLAVASAGARASVAHDAGSSSTVSEATAPGLVSLPLSAHPRSMAGGQNTEGAKAVVALPSGGVDIAGANPTAKSPAGALGVVQLLPNGHLDPAFGSGGVTTPAVPADFELLGMLREPGGDLLIVGSGAPAYKLSLPAYVLVLLSPTGQPVSSFGQSGVDTLSTLEAGCDCNNVAAVSSSGDILLAATTGNPGTANIKDPNAEPTTSWAVARLTPSGALDHSFGKGGVATVPLGGANANAVALLPDGDVVTTGTAWHHSDALVTAFTPSGVVDPRFAGGGQVGVPVELASDLDVTASGDTLIGGYPMGHAQGVAVAALTPAGALDPSFGTGGIAQVSGPDGETQLVPEPSGALLTVSADLDNSTIAVHGLASSGQPDAALGGATGHTLLPTFGGGYAYTKLGVSQNSFRGVAVARRPDGSLVFVGSDGLIEPTDNEGDAILVSQYAAAAYTGQLALDSAFGGPQRFTVSARVPAGAGLTKRGVPVTLSPSAPSLATVVVTSGKTILAKATLPLFTAAPQRLPVVLTKAGTAALKHGETPNVTVTVTVRDLAGATAHTTARAHL